MPAAAIYLTQICAAAHDEALARLGQSHSALKRFPLEQAGAQLDHLQIGLTHLASVLQNESARRLPAGL